MTRWLKGAITLATAYVLVVTALWIGQTYGTIAELAMVPVGLVVGIALHAWLDD